jgi:hypothetical protein
VSLVNWSKVSDRETCRCSVESGCEKRKSLLLFVDAGLHPTEPLGGHNGDGKAPKIIRRGG